ncbi:MAG: carboxypeptidase regulatory-like domain-containing protein [Ferruginibacter sp.]
MVWAQVTTGTLTGITKSENGEPLQGATITAIHAPTGSKYATVAGNGGEYTIPNLHVGGPYTITVHLIGYTDAVFNDVNIVLGTPIVINAALMPSSQAMQNVTVVGNTKGSLISSQRTGTSTYISSKMIQDVPTVNRNIQDYARLMPQAKAGSTASNGTGVGVSFAGQNNRYNQFTIDGANASDAFGLSSSGTNGAQANINPISMEAIQEMQIVLSPYDVTQGGFTGGGINAVTKSGTNTFHGAVYGQDQTVGLIGKSVPYNTGVNRLSIPSGFKNYTYGASLGGAIIKNKLFFYVNAERFERSTPLTFDPTVAGSGSKVDTAALAQIRSFLISKYNYDPGSYGAISDNNQSTSVFARVDWNINDKNKLVVRFNHVDGYLDVLSRSATSAVFANSGYRFSDKTNSVVLELNTNFSPRSSNVLRFTYSGIRDTRITSAFPNLVINNYDTTTKTTITYNMGSEFSSAVNGLNQDIYTLTDNFTLYRNKHTITVGTNDEFFNSKNLFLQGFYGAYTYGTSGNTNTNNISNFMNNTGLSSYSVGFSNSSDPADQGAANLHAAQLSVYGGDVWAITNQFKLTYGLRIDLPVFFNKPDANPAFNTAFASYGVATDQMPKTAPLFSPRAGFNWDVKGNATTQLRGGAGLFTGRVPFVWISNDISMTGVKNIFIFCC